MKITLNARVPTEIHKNLFVNDYEFVDFENGPVFATLNEVNTIRRSDVKKMDRMFFWPIQHFSHSIYTSSRPDLFMNGEYAIYLPAGYLHHYPSKLDDIMDEHFNGECFIKPDRGMKSFTGFCTNLQNSRIDYNTYLRKCQPEELVVISPKIDLHPVEWRFWIVDNEISTFSKYSWDDNITEHSQTMEDSVIKFANHFIEVSPLTQMTYVLDIGVTKSNIIKAIEINAVSTSGFYADMDPEKLIKDLHRVLNF